VYSIAQVTFCCWKGGRLHMSSCEPERFFTSRILEGWGACRGLVEPPWGIGWFRRASRATTASGVKVAQHPQGLTLTVALVGGAGMARWESVHMQP
jgi:hypothetical protein